MIIILIESVATHFITDCVHLRTSTASKIRHKKETLNELVSDDRMSTTDVKNSIKQIFSDNQFSIFELDHLITVVS